MNLEPAVITWQILSNFVHNDELPTAADELVRELINIDFEVEDIKSTFGHDKHILNALKEWADDIEYDDDDGYSDDGDWDYED